MADFEEIKEIEPQRAEHLLILGPDRDFEEVMMMSRSNFSRSDFLLKSLKIMSGGLDLVPESLFFQRHLHRMNSFELSDRFAHQDHFRADLTRVRLGRLCGELNGCLQSSDTDVVRQILPRERCLAATRTENHSLWIPFTGPLVGLKYREIDCSLAAILPCNRER